MCSGVVLQIVSGAEKKAFDRGGPVWPPRSNVTNDRLRGGSGRALPPQPKTGGSGRQRPPAKIFRKNEKKKFGFGWGAAPQTAQVWLGGQSLLKRSFVTFDRLGGGQMGPPRSNDFFSAPLTTRVPPGRPAERPAERPTARPSRKNYLDVPVTIPNTILRFLFFLKAIW